MRWDSPIVIASAGTLAIHLVMLVVLDTAAAYLPGPRFKPAPRVELVEIELPRPTPPPPPRPEPEIKPPDPVPEPPQRTVPRTAVKSSIRSTPTPPTPDPPPPTPTPTSDPGGGPIFQLPDNPGGSINVPQGPRTGSNRMGPAGDGGGTGKGSGPGSAELPKPMSIATIKNKAQPKGDQSYINLGRDYPPEAKTLGIEGQIRVRLLVDAQGRVASAVPLNKLGHGLDELAMRYAKELEFTPATDTDDRAVASVVVWTFTMTLPK